MARSIKHERRLLSTDELTLVEKSHHPALGLLPDHDLKELRKLVRERRDSGLYRLPPGGSGRSIPLADLQHSFALYSYSRSPVAQQGVRAAERLPPQRGAIKVLASIHSHTRGKTSASPRTRWSPPDTLTNVFGSLARSKSRVAEFSGMTLSSSP
jgi:hypothetical protein